MGFERRDLHGKRGAFWPTPDPANDPRRPAKNNGKQQLPPPRPKGRQAGRWRGGGLVVGLAVGLGWWLGWLCGWLVCGWCVVGLGHLVSIETILNKTGAHTSYTHQNAFKVSPNIEQNGRPYVKYISKLLSGASQY